MVKILRQFAKRHIRSKKNPDKSYCGVTLEWDHLIYEPKKGDKVGDMVRNRVCWKCITWSNLDITHKW